MTTEGLAVTTRAASPVILTWGLVLAAGAVVLLAGALSAPAAAVAWGSGALAAWCAALLCMTAIAAGREGLGLAQWKLGSWSLAWCAITSGLATAVWSPLQQDTAAQLTAASVLRALWLVAVGMTAWSIGYSSGPRGLAGKFAARVTAALNSRYSSSVRSRAVPWILYGIGTAARIVTVITSGRLGDVGSAVASSSAPGYQQALALATDCAPLAIAAAALLVCRERAPGTRLTLAVLFAAEITYGALAGGKGEYITAVFAMAIPFTAARRRIPKGILAAAAVIFLVIVIPFTRSYRDNAHDGSATLTPRKATTAAPGIFRQVTAATSVSVLSQSLTYLALRVQEIDGPAIIVQRTPSQIPYASPALLAEGPLTGMIPRALWPGKPILAAGNEFSQQYYGLGSGTYSSITPTGDLYRHGGWIPEIAGMFVLGCLIRILDDMLDVRNPHAIFLVILLLPVLAEAETDWITMLADIPALVLTWLVATALTFAMKSQCAGQRPGH